MKPEPVDPETLDEWQAAADGAEGALFLDAARFYGLVVGGPEVDVARCERILVRAAQLGITPRADAPERFVALVSATPGENLSRGHAP